MLADEPGLAFWFGAMFGSGSPERPELPRPVLALLEAGRDDEILGAGSDAIPLCWLRFRGPEEGSTAYGLAAGESVQVTALDGGPVWAGMATVIQDTWADRIIWGLHQARFGYGAVIGWNVTFQPGTGTA